MPVPSESTAHVSSCRSCNLPLHILTCFHQHTLRSCTTASRQRCDSDAAGSHPRFFLTTKRRLPNQFSCAACVRLCLTTVNELGTAQFMKLSFLLSLLSCFYSSALCGGRVASPQIIETFRAHTLVYDASQTKRRQNARHSCCCCF